MCEAFLDIDATEAEDYAEPDHERYTLERVRFAESCLFRCPFFSGFFGCFALAVLLTATCKDFIVWRGEHESCTAGAGKKDVGAWLLGVEGFGLVGQHESCTAGVGKKDVGTWLLGVEGFGLMDCIRGWLAAALVLC